MFRNQYDKDVSIWSPQGRIYQIEYAMEAVKQGSATVGIKSKTHAILVALKRAPSELSAHQKKILQLDEHVGMSIAGLTADARILNRAMQSECLNSQYLYNEKIPISRLVAIVGQKSQVPTQRYGRRPWGVGLLVAGYDDKGPHIYQTCPSANYYDCRAMAIGARSQSARTYLEKHLEELPNSSLDELIQHGLMALRETLPNEINLNTKNTSLSVVGKDVNFTVYDESKMDPYLKKIENIPRNMRGNVANVDNVGELTEQDAMDTEPPEPQVEVDTEERMDQD
ncbi:hypothetical protein SNEBB_008681 [Seison nebaliae]|nr:hypothetical protein SNEBB_008681 [Seison nebaliae]